MSFKKYYYLFLIIISITLLYWLPYLIKTNSFYPGLRFTGTISWFDPWDQNLYKSYINWGKQGHLMFINLYDTISMERLFIYIPYTFFGYLFQNLNLSASTLYFLMSILCSLVLGFTLNAYYFKLFNRFSISLFATILALMGGGLGFLFYPSLGVADISKALTLFSTISIPHHAISIVLTVCTIYIISFYKFEGLKNLFLIFILVFLQFIISPYIIANYLLSLGILIVIDIYTKKDFSKLKLLFTILFSFILYFLLIGNEIINSQTVKGVVSQKQYSPNLILIILGLGVILVFFIYGAVKIKNYSLTFALVWYLSTLVLIYSPLSSQYLFIRGAYVYFIAIVISGIIKFSSRNSINDLYILIGAIVFSSFTFFTIVYKTSTESKFNRYVYLSTEEVLGIDELNRIGNVGDGVLASNTISNLIPSRTNKRVYSGHELQTPNFPKRSNEVVSFFLGRMSENEIKNLLDNGNIKYVYYGYEELTLFGNKKISKMLEKVINYGDVTIYKVNLN